MPASAPTPAANPPRSRVWRWIACGFAAVAVAVPAYLHWAHSHVPISHGVVRSRTLLTSPTVCDNLHLIFEMLEEQGCRPDPQNPSPQPRINDEGLRTLGPFRWTRDRPGARPCSICLELEEREGEVEGSRDWWNVTAELEWDVYFNESFPDSPVHGNIGLQRKLDEVARQLARDGRVIAVSGSGNQVELWHPSRAADEPIRVLRALVVGDPTN